MLEVKTRTVHQFIEFYLEGHAIDIIFKGDDDVIDETVNHLETIIEELKTYRTDD